MPDPVFIGPPDEMHISDVEPFDGTGDVDIKVSQFAEEGNSLPEPEHLTDALLSGEEGPTGIDVPYEMRVVKMPIADVDLLQTKARSAAELFVKFTSQDGNTTMVLQPHIVRALPAPFTDRGSYGVVKIAGTSTGLVEIDAYDLTYTAP